jgi:hypothetical protein
MSVNKSRTVFAPEAARALEKFPDRAYISGVSPLYSFVMTVKA